jgi:serine/threonine protein kinase
MMEYVSKQESLRTEDVSRISFQLLSAVDHCAKNRIIHRDIKPENTMFKDTAPGAELRLIDFGSGCIDKVARADTDEGRHTTFAGSAFYISPEMFQKTYTSKTDVWSAGATLYVLAAGYPAEKLQKAFNILQKAKGRDLRGLPGMPEEMPDSYIEMLDKLMCYRHKVRKSAGDMLQHEFVQFHLQQEDAGLSIDDIAAVAAAVGPEPGDDENTTGRRGRPLQSIHLRESVRRHTAFLNYQQFERSVTTLLATLLMKQDLVTLIQKVDAAKDADGVSDEKNPSKLKVVPISKLREILQEMKQDQA